MTNSGTGDSDMPCGRLGHGGPIVSDFALGTMTFGVETDAAGAHRQLDLFVDRGGTFIDTADVYGAGRSEEIIGDWVAARGTCDDLVIATKGRFGGEHHGTGASRRALTQAVEGSLRRLRREAIDLYIVHGWDKEVPILDTLSVLGDLMTAGKIHQIGWSNLSAWQLQRIVSTAAAHDLPMPVTLQSQYNLLERGIEMEVLPCCLDLRIALTPWSPLGGGWLTGKYGAERRPEGATRLGEDPSRGVEAYDLRNTDRTYAVLQCAGEIAEEHGRPMSHVALAWLGARSGVHGILLGARNVAQLSDNLDAVDLNLSSAELDRLTTASALPMHPYPYNFLEDWCGLNVWTRLGTWARPNAR
ncbi:MAG: aldo/keto reductase [Pseudomonadota bacterium]